MASLIRDNLIRILGADMTRRLLESHGGRTIYIPMAPKDDHPLAAVVGEANLDKLCRLFPGEKLHLPSLKTWDAECRTAQIASSAESNSVLAERYNLTVRRVRQIRNAAVRQASPPRVQGASGTPQAREARGCAA